MHRVLVMVLDIVWGAWELPDVAHSSQAGGTALARQCPLNYHQPAQDYILQTICRGILTTEGHLTGCKDCARSSASDYNL